MGNRMGNRSCRQPLSQVAIDTGLGYNVMQAAEAYVHIWRHGSHWDRNWAKRIIDISVNVIANVLSWEPTYMFSDYKTWPSILSLCICPLSALSRSYLTGPLAASLLYIPGDRIMSPTRVDICQNELNTRCLNHNVNSSSVGAFINRV
jgi:hypothetical protein